MQEIEFSAHNKSKVKNRRRRNVWRLAFNVLKKSLNTVANKLYVSIQMRLGEGAG